MVLAIPEFWSRVCDIDSGANISRMDAAGHVQLALSQTPDESLEFMLAILNGGKKLPDLRGLL